MAINTINDVFRSNVGGDLFGRERDDGLVLTEIGTTFVGALPPTLNTVGDLVLFEKELGQGEFTIVAGNSTGFFGGTVRSIPFTVGTSSNKGDFKVQSVQLKLFRTGNPGTINFTFSDASDVTITGSGSTNGNTLTTDSGGE